MKPIFVCGCERSGTTMLGSILGSHSSVICIPESRFFEPVYKSIMNNEYDPETAINTIKNHIKFKLWDLVIENGIESDLAKYPDKLIIKLIDLYKRKNNKKANIWVDHTPLNINYLPLLNNLFPDAKMIHIVRDGRAVAASVLKLDWGPNIVTKAATWWISRLSYGFAAESYFNSKKIMRVYYEDLLNYPEKTLIKICEFVNIIYDKSMLSGNGFKVSEYTLKQHQLVGTKINKSRIDDWKKQLTKREVELFESTAGKMLVYLHYKLMYPVIKQKLKLFEKLKFLFIDLFLLRINRFNNEKRKKKLI